MKYLGPIADNKDIINKEYSDTINSFSNIAVSGQTTITAESKADTLTLIAGSNITITTNATNDSVTINSTASGGVSINDTSISPTTTYSSKKINNISRKLRLGVL